ncbi:MAG: trpS, partial [Eubacterium sp.]|nr:trpS [Eubacterium sp.]
LEPIRLRRKEFEKDIPEIYRILKQGSNKAREVAAKTLSDVKKAMKINYFEDNQLINGQIERFKS